MEKEKIGVAVFGGSNANIPDVYKEEAYELGRLIASRGWACINGGGKNGIMRACSEGAADNGGDVIGVIPQFMIDNDWHNESIKNLVITDGMHSRKQTIYSLSDALVVMPGGVGTFDEMMESITWRQLNLQKSVVIILNKNGFFDPILQMLQRCEEQNFMRHVEDGKKIWIVTTSAQQTIEEIEKFINGNY